MTDLDNFKLEPLTADQKMEASRKAFRVGMISNEEFQDDLNSFRESIFVEHLQTSSVSWPFTWERQFEGNDMGITKAQFDAFKAELGDTRCSECGVKFTEVNERRNGWCENCTD